MFSNGLIILTLFLSLGLSGCAWVQGLRDDLAKEEARQSVAEKEIATHYVPKAQYDELLKKYDDLLKAQGSLSTSVDKASENKSDLPQSVDAFAAVSMEPSQASAQKEATQMAKAEAPVVEFDPAVLKSKAPTQQEMNNYQRVLKLKQDGKFSEAMTLLKNLDSSENVQIRVRAKKIIGDIFYAQKEFDLALQAYEELVFKYGFSAHSYEALDQLISCSEQLHLESKTSKYKNLKQDLLSEKKTI